MQLNTHQQILKLDQMLQFMQAVTKAPGKPRRLRELAGEVRESGRDKSQLRLVSDSLPVYSTRSNMHFDMTETQQSNVRLLQCHCYTETSLHSLLEIAD